MEDEEFEEREDSDREYPEVESEVSSEEDAIVGEYDSERSRRKSGRFARKPGRPKREREAYENVVKRKRGRPKMVRPPPTEEELAADESLRLEQETKHVSELAELQVDDHDIALYINRSLEHVKEHHRWLVDVGRLKGKVRLLKAQFQKALEGNSNMLIWLGKHYLNQRDDIRLTTIEPEIRALFDKIERLEDERTDLLKKPYYPSEADIVVHGVEEGKALMRSSHVVEKTD